LLLGPLAGLLLASRPASLREWAWIAAGLALAVLGTLAPASLADSFLRALAAFLTGTMALSVLQRPRRGLAAIGVPVAMAAGAAVVGAAIAGASLRAIELAAAHSLYVGFTAQAEALAKATGPAAEFARAAMAELAGESRGLAAFLPAALVIESLLGAALARRLYFRVASHPVGSAPEPFARFTFSDQMIWAVVAGLALTLAPLPEPLRTYGANVLAVTLALYAARGAAVLRASAPALPGVVAATLVFVSFVLLAFVAGGLALLGLADTWLDFRRRLATPSNGGRTR
jgi:hypothetical protein